MTNPMASLGAYVKRLDQAAQQLVEALDMAYDSRSSDLEAYNKYLEAVSNYKAVHAELYGQPLPCS